MGWIEFIVVAVFGGLSKLIGDDVKAWTSHVTDRLIERAINQLPEGHRERYGEEWRSHNARLPGHIAKLIDAASVLGAAGRFAQELAFSGTSAEALGDLLDDGELQKLRELIDTTNKKATRLDELLEKCRVFRETRAQALSQMPNEKADGARQLFAEAKDHVLSLEAFAAREKSLALTQVANLTGLTCEMNGVPRSRSALLSELHRMSAEVNLSIEELEDRARSMESLRLAYKTLSNKVVQTRTASDCQAAEFPANK